MSTSPRYLRFSNLQIGKPVTAWCSACDREFHAKPKPGEGAHELIVRLRKEFDAHSCQEGKHRSRKLEA